MLDENVGLIFGVNNLGAQVLGVQKFWYNNF